MGDIRKYINIVENYERMDEVSRGDAIKSVQNFSYQIGFHALKIVLLPEFQAYNHWIGELRTFINNVMRKTTKAKIKRVDIEATLAHDCLSYHSIDRMISHINSEYDTVRLNSDEIRKKLEPIINKIAYLMDNGTHVSYNDIHELFE